MVGHHQSTTKTNGKTATNNWDDYEYTTQAAQLVRFSIINTGSQPSHSVGPFGLTVLFLPVRSRRRRSSAFAG